MPPSKEELHKRLLKREINNKKIVHERMKQFKKDILHWTEYDFVVINDDLEKCYNKIIKFLNYKTKKNLMHYDKKKIQKHIQNLLN